MSGNLGVPSRKGTLQPRMPSLDQHLGLRAASAAHAGSRAPARRSTEKQLVHGNEPGRARLELFLVVG